MEKHRSQHNTFGQFAAHNNANSIVYDFYSLCLLPDRFLEQLLRQGRAPDLNSIVGSEFDGYNTADIAGIMRMRKFRKGFFSDPILPPDEIGGYNVRVRQNPLHNSWIPVKKEGKIYRHSYFRAYPVRKLDRDNLYPNALLLNYETPRTPIWNPARTLRDYLVQVYPDNPQLLLGKAYVAFAGRRLFVSFFILHRIQAT